jgi:hypothetical protein
VSASNLYIYTYMEEEEVSASNLYIYTYMERRRRR